jgi:hypothetical protein
MEPRRAVDTHIGCVEDQKGPRMVCHFEEQSPDPDPTEVKRWIRIRIKVIWIRIRNPDSITTATSLQLQ